MKDEKQIVVEVLRDLNDDRAKKYSEWVEKNITVIYPYQCWHKEGYRFRIYSGMKTIWVKSFKQINDHYKNLNP